MTESAYSSSHTDVLDAWEEMQERHQTFIDRCETLRNNAPPGTSGALIESRSSLDDNRRIVGFGIDSESDEDAIPRGWRINKDRHVVPDKRLKAGKDAAKEIAAVSFVMPVFPGMPLHRSHGLKWAKPGLKIVDGFVWAAWSIDTDEDIDLEVWDRRNLSEYYAALESVEGTS